MDATEDAQVSAFAHPSKVRRVESCDSTIVLDFHQGVLKITAENAELIRPFMNDEEKAEEVVTMGGVVSTPVHASQEAVDLFEQLSRMEPDALRERIRLLDLRSDITVQLLHVADFLNARNILKELRLRFDKCTKFVDSELMSGTASACLDAKLFTSHSDIQSCVVLQDGLLATASGDNPLIDIWNLNTNQCVKTVKTKIPEVWALAVLQDGSLACAGDSKYIQVFCTKTWQCSASILNSRKRLSLHALAVLKDGRLATFGSYGKIKIWNVADKFCTATLTVNMPGVMSAVVIDHDRIAALSFTGGVTVINVNTENCVGLPGKKQNCLQMLPNGLLALQCYGRGNIELWDMNTNQVHATSPWITSVVTFCAIPNGDIVAALKEYGIHVWSVSTNTSRVIGMPGASDVSCIVPISDSRVVCTSSSGWIRVIDITARTVASTIDGHDAEIQFLMAFPDRTLVSGSSDGRFKLWNPDTNDCVNNCQLQIPFFDHDDDYVTLLVLLPGQRRVAYAMSEIVFITNGYNRYANAILEGHDDEVTSLILLPDDRLASGSRDKSIKIWDLATFDFTASLEEHSLPVTALVSLPDGLLASGSMDMSVKLWNLTTSECVATLKGHSKSVTCFTALPDGMLASGSEDCTIVIWNTVTHACVGTLQGHKYAVSSLISFCDGSLASGYTDGSIKLWSTDSFVCLTTLNGHSACVTCLALLPDGRFASGSYDKSIILWRRPLASDELRRDFLLSLGLPYGAVQGIINQVSE